MKVIGRMLVMGLAAMGAVALGAAIWPQIAAVVFGVLVGLLSVVFAVPVGVATRWVRRELACRRELGTMSVPHSTSGYGPAAVVPTLAELREPA